MSIAMPDMHGASDGRYETHNNPESRVRQDDGASLFSRDEIRQFAADDAEAGRRIGKILSALFIYTLLAMSVAIWWTMKTVGY